MKLKGFMARFFGAIFPKKLDPAIVTEFDANNPEHVEAVKAPIDPNIPDPATILGENYGTPFRWEHKDDLFVDFQILDNVVLGDPQFFMRYIGATLHPDADGEQLTPEEKASYEQHFYPCFTDLVETVKAHMRQNMMHLNAVQQCFVVLYQNTMGLLLIAPMDGVDITRRAIGFDDEAPHSHYQMQYMRFDAKAIQRFDLSMPPQGLYLQQQKLFPPLRVNFAKYNEE